MARRGAVANGRPARRRTRIVEGPDYGRRELRRGPLLSGAYLYASRGFRRGVARAESLSRGIAQGRIRRRGQNVVEEAVVQGRLRGWESGVAFGTVPGAVATGRRRRRRFRWRPVTTAPFTVPIHYQTRRHYETIENLDNSELPCVNSVICERHAQTARSQFHSNFRGNHVPRREWR